MLTGFVGTYEPKLDAKGRLILPAKLRDQLGSQVTMTRGQERCIYLFPSSEFERFYRALEQASQAYKGNRAFTRLMLSSVQEELPDKQGRISIGPKLREYAGLQRDLAVIGVGKRIEIWDATTWNDYLEAEVDEFANMAEEIVPGLF